jgi:hypothetical protein
LLLLLLLLPLLNEVVPAALFARCQVLNPWTYIHHIWYEGPMPEHNMASRPIAIQRLRNKQLYNSRCYVTVLKTGMFPRQKLHCNRKTVFTKRSVPRFYKQGQLAVE